MSFVYIHYACDIEDLFQTGQFGCHYIHADIISVINISQLHKYWCTDLHMTMMALFPVLICTFCTRLAISRIVDVVFGALSSGHLKYWN